MRKWQILKIVNVHDNENDWLFQSRAVVFINFSNFSIKECKHNNKMADPGGEDLLPLLGVNQVQAVEIDEIDDDLSTSSSESHSSSGIFFE